MGKTGCPYCEVVSQEVGFYYPMQPLTHSLFVTYGLYPFIYYGSALFSNS